MKTAKALHSSFDDDRLNQYLEFVRRSSPDADPTSVMLVAQLHRADHRVLQTAEKRLGYAGLSWAKFRLLLELQRNEELHPSDGMQPSELSNLQGLRRNSVSTLIGSLEKDGLISRALHGADHRKFVIRLTPQGRHVLKSKLGAVFEFATGCFAELSARDRATLLRLLTRVNASLSESKG